MLLGVAALLDRRAPLYPTEREETWNRRLLGCQQLVHADKPVPVVVEVIVQFANSVLEFVAPAWAEPNR